MVPFAPASPSQGGKIREKLSFLACRKQRGKEQANKELQHKMLSHPLSQLVRVDIPLFSPQKHAHMHNFTLLLLFFLSSSYVFVRTSLSYVRDGQRVPAGRALNCHSPWQCGCFRLRQASGERGCFYKRERGGTLPSPALASYNTSLWGFVRRTVYAPTKNQVGRAVSGGARGLPN